MCGSGCINWWPVEKSHLAWASLICFYLLSDMAYRSGVLRGAGGMEATQPSQAARRLSEQKPATTMRGIETGRRVTPRLGESRAANGCAGVRRYKEDVTIRFLNIAAAIHGKTVALPCCRCAASLWKVLYFQSGTRMLKVLLLWQSPGQAFQMRINLSDFKMP